MSTASSKVAKRSTGYLLGMSVLMLGANVVWTSYNSVLLPTMVQLQPSVAENMRGPVVGLIGFFGTLFAIVASLLAGIITDHSASKWGKRIPGILIGSLLTLPVIGIAAIFFPPVVPLIAVSFILMQTFTNIANGAWWPLLADIIPADQRGTASGIQGILTMVGAALGIVVISGLVSAGKIQLALWVIGILMAVSGIITALIIRKQDKPEPVAIKRSLWSYVGDMFRVKTRVPVFAWVVASATLANMGLNSLAFFATYFIQLYFPNQYPTPEAAASGFQLMGGISLVFTMVSAILSGIISDKVGRRPVILTGVFLCAVTTVAMAFSPSFVFFLIMTAIRSLATGPILTVIPALTSDLSPKDEAGQYMGYANLATGVSGALSAIIFGVILTSWTHTSFFVILIASAFLFLAGALIFIWKVKQKTVDQHTTHDVAKAT
jgi:MFS family permease